MKKNEFRTPLLQSAAVLGGVLVLFGIVSSSGASGSGGGILSIMFGIGNLLLFCIGMTIALLFSIALLIAIFLAAVAMVDSQQAAQMYSDLKKNFALNATALNKIFSDKTGDGVGVSKDELDQLKRDITQLQEKNTSLQEHITALAGDKTVLQNDVNSLGVANADLKMKLEDLNATVGNLQNSEEQIKALIDNLTEKIEAGTDQELREQVKKLDQLHVNAHSDVDALMERLNTLESSLKQAPVSGIFAYIESEEEQSLFIQKVEEALAQEMTYAQIDEYLTSSLPSELDQIIKDHPSLTRNYIRNLRRE